MKGQKIFLTLLGMAGSVGLVTQFARSQEKSAVPPNVQVQMVITDLALNDGTEAPKTR
jgi:hypothetical protein